MAEQHSEGGCHCGAVRYEVDLDFDQGSLKSGNGDFIRYR
jgi:hypothetical protein